MEDLPSFLHAPTFPHHSSFLPCQTCPLPVDCPWQDKEPKPGQEWCEQCWVRCSQPAAPEPTSAEVWGSPHGKILGPVTAKNTWREG